MTVVWVVVLLFGQFPAYFARENLRAMITNGCNSIHRVFLVLSTVCKINGMNMQARNREVLLLEDQLKNRHNLRRRYGRLRDAHIRELALLPDYFRQVEDLGLAARDQKLSVKEIARLAEMSRRLEASSQKVLAKGLELDQWLKRQKLDEDVTEHILKASIYRTALVTFLTVTIAAAAVFVNFNLIALPMGELVPADQLVAGVSVATISAGVIVLLELVVGVFLLEALGITHLFGFDSLAVWQVWIIGIVAFLGLLFLSTTEATLAVMREQIVAAEAALKADLAKVEAAEHSDLPMYGQAALGFSLPWIIAMVGIPLELAVESSRQLLGRGLVFWLRSGEVIFRVCRHGTGVIRSSALAVLDLYTAIPGRIFDRRTRLEECPLEDYVACPYPKTKGQDGGCPFKIRSCPATMTQKDPAE